MVQSPTLIMSGTSLRPTTAGGREEGDEYSEDDCLVEANRQSIKRNTSDDDGNVRPKNASPCLSAGRCVDNWCVSPLLSFEMFGLEFGRRLFSLDCMVLPPFDILRNRGAQCRVRSRMSPCGVPRGGLCRERDCAHERGQCHLWFCYYHYLYGRHQYCS